MKVSTLTKKGTKGNNVLRANGKTVLFNGTRYKMRVQVLGQEVLAEAEPMTGKVAPFCIFGQDNTAKEIRKRVEMGLFS